MSTITQDMKYKQSLMKYATAHGVSKASRKYNRAKVFHLLLAEALGRQRGLPTA